MTSVLGIALSSNDEECSRLIQCKKSLEVYVSSIHLALDHSFIHSSNGGEIIPVELVSAFAAQEAAQK